MSNPDCKCNSFLCQCAYVPSQFNFPEPTRPAPPMPECKPPKSEKKQVQQVLDIDWKSALEDLDRDAAIDWLRYNVPDNYKLDIFHNYEYEQGYLYIMRDETDEEYEKRLAEEAEADRWRRCQKLLKEESEAVKMERLRYENIALHAYLELHKGHPKIGDLQNLFLAAMGLERQGAAATAINQLNECRERIEKE